MAGMIIMCVILQHSCPAGFSPGGAKRGSCLPVERPLLSLLQHRAVPGLFLLLPSPPSLFCPADGSYWVKEAGAHKLSMLPYRSGFAGRPRSNGAAIAHTSLWWSAGTLLLPGGPALHQVPAGTIPGKMVKILWEAPTRILKPHKGHLSSTVWLLVSVGAPHPQDLPWLPALPEGQRPYLPHSAMV